MKLRRPLHTVTAIALSLATLAGCSKADDQRISQKAKKGYLAFEDVRLGIKEDKLKRAIFSYSIDKPGCVDGKTQYLSRIVNAYGGQYAVQCRNNQIYQIEVYHREKPASKEIALATMQRLLPPEATEQPVFQSKEQGADKNLESEFYRLGDGYRGELVLKVKETGVAIVKAWAEPSKAAVSARPTAEADEKHL
jgi:hypothetical protein